ncbi:MAG: diguanylate cyclase, partial [Kangiellaceae bacterium]|nr:diguanylate cyclase [Kangiellaceae bacterium]
SEQKVQYIVSVIQDISDKKQLEEDNKLAHVAFSHSGDGILVTDQNHTIIRTNPAFETFSGYTAKELIGRKPFLLRSGEHDETFYNHIWKALEIDGRWQGEICYRHKNGTLFYVWETISEVYDEREEVSHYVSTFADMTEMRAKQKALDDIASLDALTGLPNRYSFNINLAQAVNQAEKRHSNLALLFIDLNKFKPVNDQYGHNAGDQALKKLARRLKKAVRKQDTVARVGGDEFVVLMTQIYSRRDIESTAARIVNELSKPMSIFDFNNISVGASIGISIYPDDLLAEDEELDLKDSQTQLVEKADLAMYRAKQSQHDYCFYDQAIS